jgi:hypothetical protein
MKGLNQTTAFLWTSVGLYILSLTQMVLPGWPGWGILIMGWLSMFTNCPANWTWLANVFLLLAWRAMFTRARTPAVVLSVIAVAVAGAFLLCRNVVVGEDGSPRLIESYHLGYWLWLASTVTAALGAFAIQTQRYEDAE